MTTIETERNVRPDKMELDAALCAAAAGDRDALARLYAGTRGAVYALTLSYLKNAEDARDATQDTFLQIWDQAGKYRAGTSPMAWILTVARNTALMRLRERGRVSTMDEEQWMAIPAAAETVTREDRIFLQTALAALGDEERRIVLLHAASGLRHREIAALLSVPLSTVLSKYHRAIKKLNAFAEGECRT